MSKQKLCRSERVQYWRAVIKDFKQSGLKQSEYAKKFNIEAKYLSRYNKKFKLEPENKSTDFIEVKSNIIKNLNLKLNFTNGSSLEIPNNSDLDYLAQVVKLLQEQTC